MTVRPGSQDTADVLLRHKRTLDDLRKDNRRTSRRVDSSRQGYVEAFAGVPGASSTPSSIGSFTAVHGDWALSFGAYGDYDDIFVSLDLPGGSDPGGWVAHRPNTGAPAAGSWPMLPLSFDEPYVITVYAAVEDASPAASITVTVHLSPL